jgi:hypothetical protein
MTFRGTFALAAELQLRLDALCKQVVTHASQCVADHQAAMPLPSLYKQRGLPLKQAVCAICTDRTAGPTQLVRLTHGVSLWLCPDHASPAFRSRRGGRDFAVSLQRIWHANGCLTTQRRKALEAHLAALRGIEARPRPGSYAWPAIRREVEQRLAHGSALAPLMGEIQTRLATGPARPPSPATLRRWQRQQRWLATPAPAGSAEP